MNDNRPTEQQPKENKQPTIRDLESKMLEYEIMVSEVKTLAILSYESACNADKLEDSNAIHCLSLINRNLQALLLMHDEVSDDIFKMRHLDDRPKNETYRDLRHLGIA